MTAHAPEAAPKHDDKPKEKAEVVVEKKETTHGKEGADHGKTKDVTETTHTKVEKLGALDHAHQPDHVHGHHVVETKNWLPPLPSGKTVKYAGVTALTAAVPPLGLTVIAADAGWKRLSKIWPFSLADRAVRGTVGAIGTGLSSAAEVVSWPVRAGINVGRNVVGTGLNLLKKVTIDPLIYIKEGVRKSILHMTDDNDEESLLTALVNMAYEVGFKFPLDSAKAVIRGMANHPGVTIAGALAAYIAINNPGMALAFAEGLVNKAVDLATWIGAKVMTPSVIPKL